MCRSFAQDPDFQTAMRLAEEDDRDAGAADEPVSLAQVFLPKIELGPCRVRQLQGSGALFMAYLARQFLGNVNVYSFDTFAGMPPTDRGIDLHRAGDFRMSICLDCANTSRSSA
jgi:hypothetical protein